MSRDFYVCMPFDLPALPSVRKLRRKHGPAGVCMYYELRLMVAASYQYQQHVEVEDVLEQCDDWGMDEGQASECLKDMADARLIDPTMLGDGIVGIYDLADRAQYIAKKAAAGSLGGMKSKRKPKEKPSE